MMSADALIDLVLLQMVKEKNNDMFISTKKYYIVGGSTHLNMFYQIGFFSMWRVKKRNIFKTTTEKKLDFFPYHSISAPKHQSETPTEVKNKPQSSSFPKTISSISKMLRDNMPW